MPRRPSFFCTPGHLRRRLERRRLDADARRQAHDRPRIHARVVDARLPRDRRRHRRGSQPDALGPHRRNRPHHHRQRRADGARHRARKPQPQEPADSRQGCPDEHHLHRHQERHLLLFGPWTSAGGHGRPHRSLRRAARTLRRCAGASERADAQPRFRRRRAGRLDGGGRCVRHRQGRCRARAATRQARWQGERLLGQQQHWRGRAKGHAHFSSVSRQPAVRELSRVWRRVHEHAGRPDPGIFTHIGQRSS